MISCMLVPHDSLCMNKLFAVTLAQREQYRKLWREDLSVNSVKHTDLVREGGVLFASRWLVRDAILKDVSIDNQPHMRDLQKMSPQWPDKNDFKDPDHPS